MGRGFPFGVAGVSAPLRRGMIVEVDLEPVRGSETGKTRPAVIVTNDVYNLRVPVIQVVSLTAWSDKLARIKTNVTVEATPTTGLGRLSVADCLQTRPVDARHRLRRILGAVDAETLRRIDLALGVVFGLDQPEGSR